MPLRIFDAETKELLGEVKSYTVAHYDVTGDDIIWAVWVGAPFTSPDQQERAFELHVEEDGGGVDVYVDGWIQGVYGTGSNTALRIRARKKTD